MSHEESVFLNDHDVRVTSQELLVEGRVHPLADVSAVRVVSEASYRSKSIPFALAVGCVLWASAEVLNAPADYATAGFAGVLALLSILAVRLLGARQMHVVLLATASGEHVAMRSRDGVAVSALVKAVRQAIASRQSYGTQGWNVAQTARG